MILLIEKIRETIKGLLKASGLPHEDAVIVSNVYIRASLRGTDHHDLNDLPERLISLKAGQIIDEPQSGTGIIVIYSNFDLAIKPDILGK